MTFETVHTMTDWYDGPRRGVAIVNESPHVYESCWNNIDSDDDDVFLLSPISDETLLLAMEDWEIWQRWSLAFNVGQVTVDTHPCLPQDRARSLFWDSILEDRLVLDEGMVIVATAEFRFGTMNDPASVRMQAQWTIIPYDSPKDHRAKYRWDDEEGDPNHPMDPGS